MYGAILGDIAGSKYEFSRPEKFDPWKVKIFSNDCCFTDDTVMTIATKYAVLKGVPYAKAYGVFGRKYPNVGYGTMFKRWIDSYCERGYNSYGNGSAMRVSFIGEHFDTLKKVEDEAQKSALCTHNHPEGVKGAQVIAGCGYLAKNGASIFYLPVYMYYATPWHDYRERIWNAYETKDDSGLITDVEREWYGYMCDWMEDGNEAENLATAWGMYASRLTEDMGIGVGLAIQESGTGEQSYFYGPRATGHRAACVLHAHRYGSLVYNRIHHGPED